MPRHLITRRAHRLAIALAAVISAGAASASAAQAAVYCVHDPKCPSGGIAENTLDAALKAADADAVKDTVRIGPGSFPASDYTPVKPVEIAGAGIGATEVVDDRGSLTSGFYLNDSADTLSDLTIGLTAAQQHGVDLAQGASAKRVKVTAPHNLPSMTGFGVDAGSDLQAVVVDFGDSLSNEAIVDFGGATVSDSTFTSGLGIIPDSSGTIVRRVTVHATVPLYVLGGTLNIANALLLPHPDDPHSPVFLGAEVKPGGNGETGRLNAADVTIVGGGAGTGIWVTYSSFANNGASIANLQGVIIHGVTESVSRQGKPGTETADLTIDHSAYDATTITSSGDGTFTDKGGNLANDPDPRFVNPAAGDYRLRFDSPLLDHGPPIEPLSGDDPDLAGRSRVRDSDGTGSAVRDIGAYEYQRLAPIATFTINPASTTLGSGTGFDASATRDPDGDPISFVWAFGDGAKGSGPQADHVFGAAGSFPATLKVTDATGLTTTVSKTVQVIVPALALAGVSQSHARWLPGTKLARLSKTSRPVGTTFRFSLNRAARVRFTFTQMRPGRKVSGMCRRPTKRNLHRPRCRRIVVVGRLTLAARTGINRVAFQGRVSRTRTLKPGRYSVRVIATDSAGRRSAAHSLRFTILKP